MKRRRLLRAGAAAGCAAAVAGCLDGVLNGSNGDGGTSDGDEDGADAGDGDSGGDPMSQLPRVEDPPEEVYLPAHRDGMRMLETVRAGEYAVTPMLSVPHYFWNVTGTRAQEVTPPESDAVHLMFLVRDPETGAVIPDEAGATVRLASDDWSSGPQSPWPMLSQGMGFHVGDNFQIDGNGTYEVTVEFGAVGLRLTGEFAGRFEEGASATFEFEIDDGVREELVESAEVFDRERWGERAALEPMGAESDVPYSAAPPAEELPGETLGAPTHDDAEYAVALLEAGSRFVDGDERYLAVSPRTPFNRCILPKVALAARLDRGDGSEEELGVLDPTLDHELGFHYGTTLDGVGSGDELTLAIQTPSQTTRHQGYETAFRTTGELSIAIGDPGGDGS